MQHNVSNSSPTPTTTSLCCKLWKIYLFMWHINWALVVCVCCVGSEAWIIRLKWEETNWLKCFAQTSRTTFPILVQNSSIKNLEKKVSFSLTSPLPEHWPLTFIESNIVLVIEFRFIWRLLSVIVITTTQIIGQQFIQFLLLYVFQFRRTYFEWRWNGKKCQPMNENGTHHKIYSTYFHCNSHCRPAMNVYFHNPLTLAELLDDEVHLRLIVTNVIYVVPVSLPPILCAVKGINMFWS